MSTASGDFRLLKECLPQVRSCARSIMSWQTRNGRDMTREACDISPHSTTAPPATAPRSKISRQMSRHATTCLRHCFRPKSRQMSQRMSNVATSVSVCMYGHLGQGCKTRPTYNETVTSQPTYSLLYGWDVVHVLSEVERRCRLEKLRKDRKKTTFNDHSGGARRLAPAAPMPRDRNGLQTVGNCACRASVARRTLARRVRELTAVVVRERELWGRDNFSARAQTRCLR